ncbi:MAG: hypothetical protein ACQESX_07335 [Bacteroidota bacterium]
MYRLSIFLILIIPFLSGCFSATPIAKLEPVEENVQWNYGQQMVYRTTDSITVGMAFSRSTDRYIVFDMIFTNHSNQDILVKPETFQYQGTNEYGTLLGTKLYAADPEEKLLDIDKQLSKTNAQKANHAVLSLISTTAEATAAIASLNDTPAERANVSDDIRRNQYYRTQVRNDMEAESWSLNEQRDFWSNAVLRKTTLKPGFYVEGKVFFERNECAASCTFSIPVNGTSFEYSFKQKLIKP